MMEFECICMVELSKVRASSTKEKLTVLPAEDKKQLSRYKSKWQKIARSTDRINRARAEKTIQAIYAYANKPKPEIIFFDSPHPPAIAHFANQKTLYPPSYLLRKLRRKVNKAFREEVARSLRIELHDYFIGASLCEFNNGFYEELASEMGLLEGETIGKLDMGVYAYYDFARRLIDTDSFEAEWKLLQTWAKEGMWSFTFEGVCLICDRPTEIIIPKSGKPGTVMMKFADGISF